MTFWITPRLGTVAEGEFYEPGVVIINVSDLVDGRNAMLPIAKKIEIAHEVLEKYPDLRVVIQCHGGVSRSNTIAAAVLARWKGVELDSAMNEVHQKVPRTQYNYDLVDSVKLAITSIKRSG